MQISADRIPAKIGRDKIFMIASIAVIQLKYHTCAYRKSSPSISIVDVALQANASISSLRNREHDPLHHLANVDCFILFLEKDVSRVHSRFVYSPEEPHNVRR